MNQLVSRFPPCQPWLSVHLNIGSECANTVCADDPELSEGMPTHVQVVGKPMMDEELLEIMKVVESVAKEAS